jgi:hypothetical protein|tara:strand:- start:91 stop:312 length:222 start_codon:yes stop_codon:yes gene_type:complete
VFALEACVKVALPFALADTYKLALAVAPFAVIGINKITLLPPILASVKVVVVELAVKVTVPVEFSFPEMVLFR